MLSTTNWQPIDIPLCLQVRVPQGVSSHGQLVLVFVGHYLLAFSKHCTADSMWGASHMTLCININITTGLAALQQKSKTVLSASLNNSSFK